MTALEPQSINWQVTSNRRAHRTDRFSSQELILRRGQTFQFSVSLNRSLGRGDSLGFVVSTGPYPSESARTKAVLPLSNGTSRDGWSAQLVSNNDNVLTISISSPANAPIGRYTLSTQISSQGNDFVQKLGMFILLFNPWLQEDGVFMSNHAEREEYVQEDAGIIYVGSTNRIGMVGWNFGQFEEGILDICLSVLDHSLNFRRDPATDVARRNDPKYVGRVLSAMVNGNDDNGVISGNWSGNYTGGRDPRNWNGSVEILKEWKRSGFRPVRYGQCWVFAGTLNTVLRSFGIPSRVVTNFNSAHDTDRNLSVDVYYDPMGPMDKGSDSVWNFHVWNEGWFVRPDLGPLYNGWQVLDATPQERSQGVFQCGPASVTAIREGDVNLDFDMPFVFAEVNADRIAWIYDVHNNSQKPNSSDTHSIGRYISTKAVGTNSRMDITEKYKLQEGSSQERQVFEKALGKLKPHAAFGATSARHLVGEGREPSVSGKFKVTGILEVGKEVNMALILKNLTSDMKTVTVNMTAWTIVYNGTLVHEVWKDSVTISLDPEEEVQHPVKITYAQYEKYLKADNMIRTTAVCQASDEAEVLVERDIILDNPSLTLEVLDQARVQKPVNVQMLFSNPLDEPVKDCVLMVEGSGLLLGSLRIDVPTLRPKERSRVRFEILPTRSGTKQLLADFSCNKFPAIKAMLSIDVVE
uniref:protein-glutamine gamma-glutamyltransferase n=1 Tax=Suricata suricatta TaxID=37032 RepID=A0A673UMJ4_SURSU